MGSGGGADAEIVSEIPSRIGSASGQAADWRLQAAGVFVSEAVAGGSVGEAVEKPDDSVERADNGGQV